MFGLKKFEWNNGAIYKCTCYHTVLSMYKMDYDDDGLWDEVEFSMYFNNKAIASIPQRIFMAIAFVFTGRIWLDSVLLSRRDAMDVMRKLQDSRADG